MDEASDSTHYQSIGEETFSASSISPDVKRRLVNSEASKSNLNAN